MCVFTEKLYNVDEALLASMEEKHRILSDEVERLEKESQSVRKLQYWPIFMGTDQIMNFIFSLSLTTGKLYSIKFRQKLWKPEHS